METKEIQKIISKEFGIGFQNPFYKKVFERVIELKNGRRRNKIKNK